MEPLNVIILNRCLPTALTYRITRRVLLLSPHAVPVRALSGCHPAHRAMVQTETGACASAVPLPPAPPAVFTPREENLRPLLWTCIPRKHPGEQPRPYERHGETRTGPGLCCGKGTAKESGPSALPDRGDRYVPSPAHTTMTGFCKGLASRSRGHIRCCLTRTQRPDLLLTPATTGAQALDTG